MQYSIHNGACETTATDLLVIGVVTGEVTKTPLVQAVDRALNGAIKASAKDLDFTGKAKQSLVLSTLGQMRAKRVALIGLGAADKVASVDLFNWGGNIARLANGVGAKQALVVWPELAVPVPQAVALIARGAHLGAYRFLEYKGDKGRKNTLSKVALHPPGRPVPNLALRADQAQIVAEGVALARDLVNRSALQLYPETFAKEAQRVARAAKLSCKVFGPAELNRMGMRLILGVGAGSTRGPRLVHLTYVPKQAGGQGGAVALVGKGVTFDSGGLSLKPTTGMVDMKADMAGAATVLAVMQVVARLQPKVTVHGVMALAENMPSGSAIRPGDVIEAASGRTVEIVNTDAEGRLVLADALHYTSKLKPRRVIDIATLTGACVVALGQHITGLWANNEKLAADLLGAARESAEDFWRMPLCEAQKSQIKSDIADTKNSGDRWGAAITAALFLREFVGEAAWAHLDIAGPATSAKDAGALTKGGTGVAVATLANLLTSGRA
jgi:leucyl aminopeptidase